MTDTDRIAQMAREAGADEAVEGLFYLSDDNLARFARLVAEDCAKVCDGMPYRAAGAGKAAQEIRARYSKETP